MTDLMFSLSVLIVLAVISSAQPYLTRPELFFAVTVARDFRSTETARGVVRYYRSFGWLGTIAVVALLFARTVVAPAGIFLAGVVWGFAFLIARHRVRPHRVAPTTVREASLSLRRERVPGGLPAMLGPFVILAVKAALVYRNWDRIPERFPVHWDFNGPDRWADRTPLAVYGAIGSIAFICAVMILIAYATIHRSRKISPAGSSDDSEERFRKVGVLGLVCLAYLLAIVLPPITGAIPEVPFAPFWIIGFSAVFLGVLIWFGQGGTRLRGYQPVLTAAAPATGDRTPDDCWKLGMFYYNRNDPALVVEKRFGIGWTLNFGNPWCWILVPALVLMPFVMSYIIR